MQLTEAQVEELAETFLEKVDDLTGPDKMSIPEAIDSWRQIRDEVVSSLATRINASEADLAEPAPDDSR